MAQIVEREIRNLLPLVRRGSSFERSKPVMNSCFRQLLLSLRCKDIGTLRIASHRAEDTQRAVAGPD